MHEAEVERKLEWAGLQSRLRLQLRRRGGSLDAASLQDPGQAVQVLTALAADGDEAVRELASRLHQLLPARTQPAEVIVEEVVEAAIEEAVVAAQADARRNRPAVRDYRFGARGGWAVQG